MGNVLQLVRQLDCRPLAAPVDGVELRHFGGPADIDLWLEIRRKAFARQKVGIRDWTRQEFAEEFLDKPWWKSELLWFAESVEPSADAAQAGGNLTRRRGDAEQRGGIIAANAVGTATLGWRGAAESGTPVIHWLAVLPRYRRQGIGRLLVQHLEQIVWDAGRREIFLETHAGWTEALALYRALGYRDA